MPTPPIGLYPNDYYSRIRVRYRQITRSSGQCGFIQVERLVRDNVHRREQLSGSKIWPFDVESAKSIDAIVSSLLDKANVDEAVKNTSDIEFDASVVFLRYLSDLYENQSFEYLKSLIQQSPNENISFNAYQFLSENFELDPSERLRLSSFLDGEGLQIMFSDEVIGTLQEELYSDPAKYELWSDVDSLSSHSRIDDVWVELINFGAVLAKNVSVSDSPMFSID